MAALPPVFTAVYDAMVLCDVNDINQHDGETPAERIASETFMDDFTSCMDKKMDDRLFLP